MTKKVLVLGSSFAGLTAAFTLKHDLHDDVDVTVVSPRNLFVFNPSLIWLPFGKRDRDDITFDVAPVLDEHGIDFIHQAATSIDPEAQTVSLADGSNQSYDYLVVATGYYNDLDVVDGFRENTTTITALPAAEESEQAWLKYLENPGDIVIGATQGASCFGAAYEFLFNTSYHLKKNKLKDRVKLTYVTSEPFLGHFGIGGLPNGDKLLGTFLKKEGIDVRLNASVDHFDDGAVTLSDGEQLPYSYSMFIPPFLGQDFLKDVPGLADPKGYIPVRDTYQTNDHDNIYAVGIAAQVTAPWQTPTPVGIPKTGFPTEQMAHVAAVNIASQIRGQVPHETKEFADIPAVCVMDAGNNGVIILADKMLPPRKHGVLIPGPQAHLMKLGFEKYFLWKMKGGHVALP
ncbi:MAG: FAD-dependent oxidoreductase [Actinomycetales bacterium]|nr:FAD-dependent oxidoreductase [Actinomycetales bacterium]